MQKIDGRSDGVFVISVTPFDESGALELDGVEQLVDFYRSAGASGLTILGMMGEAPKLSQEESTAFATRVIKACSDMPVVVGVSSPGFAAMRELSATVMDEGVEVLLCGRSAEVLERNAAEIEVTHGVVAHHLPADLTDSQFPKLVAERAIELLGRIDILVNNTGGPAPGKVSDMSADDLAKQAQMMLFSIIELTNLLLPSMRGNNWGRILTIASSGVVQPIPNLAMSNTLRSALVGWSKSLSNELAADGVTCNLIVPGRIHTSRVDQLDEATAKRTGKPLDEVRASSMASIPAGRYGRVEEFADMATFLCSDRAGDLPPAKSLMRIPTHPVGRSDNIRSAVPAIRSPREVVAERGFLMSPLVGAVKRFEACDTGAARGAVRAL